MKWFRFYHDALDDPKVQRLPGDLYKFWVNMLCLGSRSKERGLVRMTVSEIAFDVRLDEDAAESMMAELIARGLIEDAVEGFQIHNWDARQFKSDNVAERVAQHRESKKSEDVTLQETLQVTPDETLESSVYTDTQINRVTDVQSGSGANAPATPTHPKPKASPKPKPKPVDPNAPMPRNGPAQTMLAVLHEDILKTPPPTDYGRAVKKADALVKAGCRQREFQEIVEWMLRDPWYAEKGVTIFTVFDARDKYLAAKSRPGGLTIHQGGRFNGERVGRDGLTDAERGWRENPGHKGWSADELMRMANAMEQQERERNTA